MPTGLLRKDNLVSAFSSRRWGNMSLFYGDRQTTLDNRKNFLKTLNIPYQDLVCAEQSHGSKIKLVTERQRGRGALSGDTSLPDTDALITDRKNLPLAVFTADCLSIFLSDREKSAIGLVHAGWRSTKENILAKTIKLLQDNFHLCAEDLFVDFGPGIRSCCYTVGENFKEMFSCGLIQRDGRDYLDLAEINKKQALGSGIRLENIRDCAICTSCRNEEFFSYRREGGTCNRMMSVMMLK